MKRRLTDLFNASVRRTPTATAIRTATSAWTYADLACGQLRVVDVVRRALPGEQRQRVIGVAAGKDFGDYAALLGVMQSGSIYLPLDPDTPPERLKVVLSTAAPALVIAALHCRTVVRVAESMKIRVMENPASGGVRDTAAQPSLRDRQSLPPGLEDKGVSDGDIAYLLFTSGTTGMPKGVPIPHLSAVGCLDQMASLYPLRATDRVLSASDPCFDFAMAETFLTLGSSACLVPCSSRDFLSLPAIVGTHDVNVWMGVPSLAASLLSMGLFAPGSLRSIRLSMFGGEPLRRPLVDGWRRAAPQSQIVNLYGPTEAAIFVSSFDLNAHPVDRSVFPLGEAFPFVGWKIDVPPDSVPDGEGLLFGELLLTGRQIANGYWNDPAATRRSFLTSADGRRWYRTGDRVAYRPGSGWIFGGRLDHQIKVGGWRIELDAVSAAVSSVTGCSSVASVPVCASDGSYVGIVTYCVGLKQDRHSVLKDLRRFLPPQMLPQRLEAVATLPVLSNGKIDHRRLFQITNPFIEEQSNSPFDRGLGTE